MAAILHIKDSYYFEVPRILWRSNCQSIHEFPEVWIQNDPEYQAWEADQHAHNLEELIEIFNSRQTRINENHPTTEVPDGHAMVEHWQHWQHEDHMNAGRPFDLYVERELASFQTAYQSWEATTESTDKSATAFFADKEASSEFHEASFLTAYTQDSVIRDKWTAAKESVSVKEYLEIPDVTWTEEKIEAYNARLHGKILIPQPFGGKLRNFYEPDSGLCISKFMIIEVVVSLLLIFAFTWLGRRVSSGKPAKGKAANFLETFLVFIRDEIAKPSIGHGHEKFVPILWSLFMFILACNLFGMLPWLGAPTGMWSVTGALALVTFGTVVISGMRQFGVVGFFTNHVPPMDLPAPIAIVIKPFIFAIEMLGLLIKHAVLSIRLLANMVAGHLVLLAVFGLAFGFEAFEGFTDAPGWQHPLAMGVVIIGTTLFSVMELFVAFLQAYVFTLLSALFIGAAVHHH
jgi:F-type H+-transporting ATPase subunit a